jgi:glucokinase
MLATPLVKLFWKKGDAIRAVARAVANARVDKEAATAVVRPFLDDKIHYLNCQFQLNVEEIRSGLKVWI